MFVRSALRIVSSRVVASWRRKTGEAKRVGLARIHRSYRGLFFVESLIRLRAPTDRSKARGALGLGSPKSSHLRDFS